MRNMDGFQINYDVNFFRISLADPSKVLANRSKFGPLFREFYIFLILHFRIIN